MSFESGGDDRGLSLITKNCQSNTMWVGVGGSVN